ncbi:MAG: ABC transporter permease [Armatimonadota bacterium]|nr:ABC transporter permease [Armatimonadota bacterium]
MLKDLCELFRYRELFFTLVQRDLKARYKRSVLGFFWSLLNPLLQVATLTVIFKYVIQQRVPITNFAPFLFVAFLPWTFFQLGLMDASTAVPLNVHILKRVYFPREILPLANVASNLVHFLMAMLVLFLYLGVHVRIHFAWDQLLYLPLIIALQTLLVAGFALLVSCMSVYFMDVHYIVTVLLNLLYWASCIFYPLYGNEQMAGLATSRFAVIAELNTLVPLVTLYRQSILTHSGVPDAGPVQWELLVRVAVWAFAALAVGYAVFNWRKWEFAERT